MNHKGTEGTEKKKEGPRSATDVTDDIKSG
jgi:hypothetical protein